MSSTMYINLLKLQERQYLSRRSQILIYVNCLLSLIFIITPHSARSQPTPQLKKKVIPTLPPKEDSQMMENAQRRVNKISDQLKSPFCPGKTLMTCTSPNAYELRREMIDMMVSGKTDAQIIAELRASFGDVIENPPQPWYTILVPIMPFVFGVILAIFIFGMWLRGNKSGDGDPASDAYKTSEDIDEVHRTRLKDLMLDD